MKESSYDREVGPEADIEVGLEQVIAIGVVVSALLICVTG